MFVKQTNITILTRTVYCSVNCFIAMFGFFVIAEYVMSWICVGEKWAVADVLLLVNFLQGKVNNVNNVTKHMVKDFGKISFSNDADVYSPLSSTLLSLSSAKERTFRSKWESKKMINSIKSWTFILALLASKQHKPHEGFETEVKHLQSTRWTRYKKASGEHPLV